jgi:hypothetical protein
VSGGSKASNPFCLLAAVPEGDTASRQFSFGTDVDERFCHLGQIRARIAQSDNKDFLFANHETRAH